MERLKRITFFEWPPQSDILSDIHSDIPSGILIWHIFWQSIGHSIWQILWYSIWHLFWHSDRHFVWHTFWHSIWHLFWHSIWHTFWHLSGKLSGILSGTYLGILSRIYSYSLWQTQACPIASGACDGVQVQATVRVKAYDYWNHPASSPSWLDGRLYSFVPSACANLNSSIRKHPETWKKSSQSEMLFRHVSAMTLPCSIRLRWDPMADSTDCEW